MLALEFDQALLQFQYETPALPPLFHLPPTIGARTSNPFIHHYNIFSFMGEVSPNPPLTKVCKKGERRGRRRKATKRRYSPKTKRLRNRRRSSYPQ